MKNEAPKSEAESAFGEDPKPYILAGAILLILELFNRAFLGHVPPDFTAYISAGDAFAMGLNPYTDARQLVPRFGGFPYNYLPGSLYPLQIVSYFSTTTLTVADWILKSICLIGIINVFHRKMFPDLKLGFIICVTILFQPLGVDLLAGNIVTYLFAAFVFSYAIAQREKRKLADYFFVFLFGFIISFKPFWSIPIGYLFLVFRRPKLLTSFIAGFLVIPLMTIPLWDWIPSWLAHTSKMREYYFSVDFLSLSPVLLGLTWIIGMGIGLYFLLRKERIQEENWIWLLGCVSLPMWPRLATYSYVICLPLILFFCQRWGWKKGLLFASVLGPFAWVLRALTFLPNSEEEQWAFFIWIFVAAFFLIRELRISAARTEH